MRLPLSRTRAKWAHRLKGFIFDVADLQSMIDLREKHQLEDSMGFRGQWESHRQFQIAILKSIGLKQSHHFLELGCGPLTAGIPIIDYLDADRYTGVDIRSSVLDMSWREIGKAKLSEKNPRLICSKYFGDEALLPGQKFDFVYSFSVLYHLSDEILDAYFLAVSRRLSKGGKCIANINVHLPSDRWLEFPFIKRSVETYRDCAASHGLSTENLGTIERLGFSGQGTEKHNPLLVFCGSPTHELSS